MHKTSRSVLSRFEAIDGLSHKINQEIKENMLVKENVPVKENALDFNNLATNANKSSLDFNDFNKRNEARIKNSIRLAIKPVHILAIMLILVVCLACSLTMLIGQYATYSKFYAYNASKVASKTGSKSVRKTDDKVENKSSKIQSSSKNFKESSVNGKNSSNAIIKDNEGNDYKKRDSKSANSNKDYAANSENKDFANNALNKKTCININTAGIEELQEIKGVGPKMAQRILDMRKKVRVFKRVEDLLQVNGIGPKTFAKIKPMTCIG